jgi:group II intron reverse transcriptase/maturase
MVFTTLAHHINLDLLREAYRRTRKDGAAGIDGQTAAGYAENLEANLQSLLDRAKPGRYRAPPVRRVHIPKGDGKATRPIGIPTIEDKVLQRAVVMVLEAVYEQDFLSCSYGFRPGRSAHDALSTLREGLMTMGGGWVLEVDIKDFFGTLEHAHLRDIIRQRVRDGVLIRLIGKWLNAGVQEDGSITRPAAGTPQGGVISPLLANVYLHEVLDKWFEHTVKPRLRGRAFLVRYADDFAIAFSVEEDARRVQDVLPKRFAKYGLTVHPEKTRLVEFRRPPGGPPGSFDLLGFTHYWAKSRRGFWVIKQQTAASRLRRSLRRIADWCRTHRHWKIREQHAKLVQKLRGHCAYYGITGNARALEVYRHELVRTWKMWLCRRSHKARRPWEWFRLVLETYPIPPARAIHSTYRHAAKP